jgi:PAS domain S-box-containing protein
MRPRRDSNDYVLSNGHRGVKDVETHLVLAALADAVVVADLQERIVYANAAAAALFGWSTSELLGERLFKLMPVRMRAAHEGGFRRYTATRRSHLMGRAIRVPALHREGHEIDVELTLSLARVSGEDIVVACLRDLRGRVDMERQLSHARYLQATTLTAARMAERLDEEHVARTAAQAAVEVFGAAFAQVWVTGEGSPRLLAASPAGSHASLPGANGVAAPPYDVAAISARRDALITAAPADDAALDRAWLTREQVVSVAAYPLAIAEDRRGALCCFFRRPLEGEAIEPLGTLACITSSSLKAAQLFEREQAARTAVRASEAWLSTALRSIGEAVIIADTDERIVFMNPSAEDLTDTRAASARGRPLDEVLRIVDKDNRKRERITGADGGRVKWDEPNDELVLLGVGGALRQIEQSAAPIRDDDGKHLGEIVVFRDVTERRRSEERQSFINAATDLLATSLDYETTLGTVAWLAVPRIADWCGIDLLDSPEELRQVTLVHVDAAKLSIARELRRAYPPTPDDASGAFLAVRSGRPILRSDGAEGMAASAPEALELRQELGICSSLLVPLIARGRTLGVISFFFAESGRRFGRADLAMAEELAVRAALAVDNARLFQAIQRARDQLDAILRGVDDGITAQDPAGRVIYANDEAARAMGCASTRTMLAAPLPELFKRVEVLDEDGLPVPLEALPAFRVLRGTEAPEAAVCFRYRATGEVRWFIMKATPVFDDNGAVELVITISHDVTERRRNERAERALVNVSAALGESLDSAATLSKVARIVVPSFAALCLVHLRDGGGAIQRVATAHADAAQMDAFLEKDRLFPPDLGAPYGPGKVIHTGEPDLVRDAGAFFAALSSREQKSASEHARLLTRLGARSLLCVPLAARGRTLGAITFVASPLVASYDERDLAFALELGRRAGLAVDNARLYSETRDAVRARDDFLTVASHELKTPLTSMLLAVQSILRGTRRGDDAPAPAPLLAKIAIVDRQSQRLAQLIEQLLDISRVTAGRLVLDIEAFDLPELCRAVLARHEGDLRVAGCVVELHVEGPIEVRWDRTRIDQVITHLLSNAIKFGPGKPIEIEITDAPGRVTLRVRDHGIGIDPADQERIFQRFERAVSARHYGGFGMGLWISRRIVEMLGGSILVESSPAAGSTFTVELPIDGSARAAR